ncbi:Pyridine nucleotide-disulfide oxidoreductase dimerization region precursor [Sphingopyxis sp. LC81]|uniref:FAD-dependent oxidoreductase n=1 Tax=Sphingopyxis sp. LC81 TaxID=1502850 RepID=UPI00050F66E4|nr:bifunctional TVP38/TMEM64 family protein/FAD-dependent oxidoreductase [Sphingopyxis sp. LC81]KGB53601.1 Pyridine nucleotide-disulfide oxidoreductase dimerization region precursor [Sphingopyxis sp. LC81]
MNKRFVLLLLLVLALAAWVHFDLGDWLTLEALKSQQAAIDGYFRANPLLVAGLFFLVYVVLTALSVPGAAILTLAAGAIFGLYWGTLIVSFASTIGATFAFLASRYLFRDAVQARFGDRLRRVNEGIARDGAFYLFSLRLVPVFPFFAVNLLMGLTPIRTVTYFWVSQLGMFLGTIIYVNAGTQLARIDALSDIASPGLLASFAALGLLPWIGKWIMATIKRRRIYARFNRPRRFDRNLVVIGAGAAGLVSSYIAATVKAKVTLVEASKMGGDCLNYGCVPSKALIKSARIAEQMRHADRYGLVSASPQIGFRSVMQRIHDIIATIEPHDSVERYTELGVDVVQGYARIIDPWTVEIARNDGEIQRLTTRAIVIAAGAEPVVPDLPGLADSGYLTSDTLWEEFAARDIMPQRIIILGGGPIGSELSQAFARLGADVSQVERGARLLPREDEEVSELARDALEGAGVEVLTGHEALRVEGTEGARHLIVGHAGGERAIAFDALIVAVGRKARMSGYGLEDLGIETQRTVVTDEYLATVFPNIYAAGDVAGPYQFTHSAAHQAWYASVNALFGQFRRFKADYRVIPWTTFIDPEVARVGLSEAEAIEKGVAVEVTRYPLHELDRAIADSATTGFVKVLTPPGKDRILGVTIVGEHAGELLAEYVLAMKHGLGLGKILGTIHTYPTMAEANKYAAGEWKRAHAPERLLKLVGRYHDWRRG